MRSAPLYRLRLAVSERMLWVFLSEITTDNKLHKGVGLNETNLLFDIRSCRKCRRALQYFRWKRSQTTWIELTRPPIRFPISRDSASGFVTQHLGFPGLYPLNDLDLLGMREEPVIRELL